MSRFQKLVDSPAGKKYIMQGNEAFALGVVHAGYHAADGYPGTPSTEVIDKGLALVQDRLLVGWSVNEAVSMGVAVGHSIAGSDTVVTMKIPGVFQAGDAISTSAFFTTQAGALVIYAATDYIPSSTQHVIDVRHFLASSRLPILEPRHHQELYDMAWLAADMSKQFHTPVVVLVSGILSHSEGLVTIREPRTVARQQIPENLHAWMLTPALARENYNLTTTHRIPEIRHWIEETSLAEWHHGSDPFGIICNGEATMIVKETLNTLGLNPSILSLAITNPLPEKKILAFADNIKNIKGQLFIVEDGDKFLQERIQLMGIALKGKEKDSIITNWTPEDVVLLLADHIAPQNKIQSQPLTVEPVKRPPSICPGCPYRAFGLTVAKLKKKKKIYASFGDIGCSTLLYFLNALDTVLCMGASDSMRQGFVLSQPAMAHRTISVIGDSCECHSGLDATRNAVFRHTPGVKVILDNSITAMTGGQPAPSSKTNLSGKTNKFNLKDAVAAEKARTVPVNAYHLKEVEQALTEALDLAEKGEFTVLILEGSCIHEVEPKQRIRQSQFVPELCKKCGLCSICPGIEVDAQNQPHYTPLCSNCGGNMPVCKQRCNFGAIQHITEEEKTSPLIMNVTTLPELPVAGEELALPVSLRLAIRGIGGQGNLFFGKVLAEVALRTSYAERSIVKGDTHGMAQLGGPVISTFACGDVFSPVFAPRSADVLVAMEISEVLRPGFLELLKENGTILLNHFKVLPTTMNKEDYPDIEKIKKTVEKYNVISLNAYDIADKLGDKTGKTVNVIVLGILSTIAPFNQVPLATWSAALATVAPKEAQNQANQMAFMAGRNYFVQ